MARLNNDAEAVDVVDAWFIIVIAFTSRPDAKTLCVSGSMRPYRQHKFEVLRKNWPDQRIGINHGAKR